MRKLENWTCPFCGHAQTVVDEQRDRQCNKLQIKNHRFGEVGYDILARGCANDKCGEIEFQLWFSPGKSVFTGTTTHFISDEKAKEHYRIRPRTFARPQTAAVPAVLAKDYYEACSIRDLSPKASATLSRRVLQGMIRGFCGITRKDLFQEIDALKDLSDAGQAPKGVDTETIEAMHHVRAIGNIGAHMEKDIGVIVDVDPNEAQLLIGLVEMLFKDWYVAKANREASLAALKKTADQKALDKKLPPAALKAKLPATTKE